jgi:hypothetical protein
MNGIELTVADSIVSGTDDPGRSDGRLASKFDRSALFVSVR